MIDETLLDLLRCPFHPDSDKLIVKGSWLICPVDGTGFRIIGDIPDMLPEDAVPAEQVQKELQETHL